MELVNIQWFEVSSVVGWTVVAMLLLAYLTMRARRRTVELEITKSALEEHFRAVERIVDDPALPISALEFIASFSETIGDETRCKRITDKLAEISLDSTKRRRQPAWAHEMEVLSKTRPDLLENLLIAIHAGFTAMFNRWPGNSWKWQLIQAKLASDRRKQAAFADRVVHMNDKRNGGPIVPGGMVPA
jgi:hypothetical protein